MRTKDEVREEIWRSMDREGVARFPGAEGRIPNFAGAKPHLVVVVQAKDKDLLRQFVKVALEVAVDVINRNQRLPS